MAKFERSLEASRPRYIGEVHSAFSLCDVKHRERKDQGKLVRPQHTYTNTYK